MTPFVALAIAASALAPVQPGEARADEHMDAAENGAAVVAQVDDERDSAAPVEPVERRSFVLVEGAWSGIDNGSPDWWEAAIEGATPVSDRTTVGARASWYRRFGVEDIELSANAVIHPGDDLWLRMSAGGTPDATFRPEIFVTTGADYRLSRGPTATVVGFDLGYRRFPLQDVISINPGLVQYFADGRMWATLRGIGTIADGGPLEVGALGRIDYSPDERQRYFAGIANGPDTDLGIVTRTTSLFTGAVLPLGNGLALTPSLAQEWREVGGDRLELRIGVRADF